MHKGKKHSIKEGYENFARSEQAEAEKYVDSVKTNNPFGEGLDSVVDEEARRRETGYYVKGTYKAKGKKPSPSGKKTKSGKIKMVNNCVKK